MNDLFSNSKDKKQNQSKGLQDDVSLLVADIGKALLLLLAAGVLVPLKAAKDSKSKISKYSPKQALRLICVSATAGSLMLILILITDLSTKYKVILWVPTIWSFGFAMSLAYVSFGDKSRDSDFITTADLDTAVKDFAKETDRFSALHAIMEDPDVIPLGISLKDGSPVTLPMTQVLEHSLSSGATGQGKTTLLKTKIHHFIKHKRPVIIIDPKGEKKDVEEIRALCQRYGRPEAFKLFSLSDKVNSAFYNSVKIGDPQQKKAKLMNGLNLSHEYYGALADEFLTTILDAHAFLDRPVALELLRKYIVNPKVFGQLEADIRNLPRSKEVDDLLEQIGAARKIELKELRGLSAQLASLNAFNIKDILNPREGRDEIDLLETLQTGGVAYFQMNINGYSIAKAIGKLIVQDLRLVSNMIQSGQATRTYDFAFVSIDEFGSFVYADFADYIKQVRSAGIGLDLSFQVIADTKLISPEFADQILGNTASKFILRQDIKEDVETWSAMAGTKDVLIESHQTTMNLFYQAEQTGMGNLHTGKAVLIDFDAFKQLTTGNGIFIDKKRHKNFVFAIWSGEPKKLKQQSTPPNRNVSGEIVVRTLRLKEPAHDLQR